MFMDGMMLDARNEPDEDDWPTTSKLRDFNELEKILSCGICKGFLTNPKELPCGHLYCAECISRSMDNVLWKGAKNECPTCRAKTVSGQCRPNVPIGKLVAIFKSLRKDVVELIERDSKGTVVTESPAKSVSDSKRTRGRPRKVIQEEESGDEFASSSSSSSSSLPVAASRKGTPIEKTITFHSFGNKTQVKKIKEQLGKVSAGSRVSLRMDGDDKKLMNRYRNFVHLHNAQVGGGDTALTLEEVVRRCNEDESIAERESRATRPTEVAMKMTGDDGFKNLILLEKKRKQKLANGKADDTATTLSASASTSSSIRGSPTEDKENDDAQLGSIGDQAEGKSPTEPSSKSSSESPATEYTIGKWNVLWSSKLSEPFFFDKSTSRGQMEVPSEFRDIFSGVSSEESMVDAVNMVNSSLIAQEADKSSAGAGVGMIDDETGSITGVDLGKKADSPFDLTSEAQEGSVARNEPAHWDCNMCTFRNSINKAVCEMCKSKCPLQTKRTRSQKSVGPTQTTLAPEISKKARR